MSPPRPPHPVPPQQRLRPRPPTRPVHLHLYSHRRRPAWLQTLWLDARIAQSISPSSTSSNAARPLLTVTPHPRAVLTHPYLHLQAPPPGSVGGHPGDGPKRLPFLIQLSPSSSQPQTLFLLRSPVQSHLSLPQTRERPSKTILSSTMLYLTQIPLPFFPNPPHRAPPPLVHPRLIPIRMCTQL